jgi:hypothetical protein
MKTFHNKNIQEVINQANTLSVFLKIVGLVAKFVSGWELFGGHDNSQCQAIQELDPDQALQIIESEMSKNHCDTLSRVAWNLAREHSFSSQNEVLVKVLTRSIIENDPRYDFLYSALYKPTMFDKARANLIAGVKWDVIKYMDELVLQNKVISCNENVRALSGMKR